MICSLEKDEQEVRNYLFDFLPFICPSYKNFMLHGYIHRKNKLQTIVKMDKVKQDI